MRRERKTELRLVRSVSVMNRRRIGGNDQNENNPFLRSDVKESLSGTPAGGDNSCAKREGSGGGASAGHYEQGGNNTAPAVCSGPSSSGGGQTSHFGPVGNGPDCRFGPSGDGELAIVFTGTQCDGPPFYLVSGKA
jgi:hypothetical protein